MFDIGFGEMLLLAAIALIALGPKQLPEVARTIGRFMNQVKRATGEFQRTIADVSEATNKHVESVHKSLEQKVIPPDFLNSSNSITSPATSSVGSSAPQSVATEVGDDHQQMSFEIDKKES